MVPNERTQVKLASTILESLPEEINVITCLNSERDQPGKPLQGAVRWQEDPPRCTYVSQEKTEFLQTMFLGRPR